MSGFLRSAAGNGLKKGLSWQTAGQCAILSGNRIKYNIQESGSVTGGECRQCGDGKEDGLWDG